MFGSLKTYSYLCDRNINEQDYEKMEGHIV